MSLPESKKHIEDDIESRSDIGWSYSFPVHNQNYVVLNIIDVPNGETSAIKIFGVYSSLAEANDVSEKISKENDFFNVYVASTNAWLPIPVTRDLVENVEYQEGELKKIKKSHEALKEREAKALVETMKKDKENKEKSKSESENGQNGVEESKN